MATHVSAPSTMRVPRCARRVAKQSRSCGPRGGCWAQDAAYSSRAGPALWERAGRAGLSTSLKLPPGHASYAWAPGPAACVGCAACTLPGHDHPARPCAWPTCSAPSQAPPPGSLGSRWPAAAVAEGGARCCRWGRRRATGGLFQRATGGLFQRVRGVASVPGAHGHSPWLSKGP